MLTHNGYDIQLPPLPLGYAGMNKTNVIVVGLGITKTQALTGLERLHTHAIICLKQHYKKDDIYKDCRTAKSVIPTASLGQG